MIRLSQFFGKKKSMGMGIIEACIKIHIGVAKGGYMWLAWDGDRELVSIPDQTVQLFSELEVQLSRHGFRWSHVALVYLYLSRMADYPSVNGVYSRYFPSQPPAR